MHGEKVFSKDKKKKKSLPFGNAAHVQCEHSVASAHEAEVFGVLADEDAHV